MYLPNLLHMACFLNNPLQVRSKLKDRKAEKFKSQVILDTYIYRDTLNKTVKTLKVNLLLFLNLNFSAIIMI